MSAATLNSNEPAVQVQAGKGFRELVKNFSFPTTDLTCTIPVDLSAVDDVQITPVGAPGLGLIANNLPIPTTSASATYRYRVPKAGVISAIGLIVGTTV